MNFLLDDIYAYLNANGIPPTGWVLYEGFFADDQDQVIAIFDTGGMPFDTMAREYEHVTFQVRCRASKLDYVTCRTMWQTVFNLLQDAHQTSGSPLLLPGYALIQCLHAGPLTFLDDKGRPNSTMNFRVYKTRTV
jgi:hypothetical protein